MECINIKNEKFYISDSYSLDIVVDEKINTKTIIKYLVHDKGVDTEVPREEFERLKNTKII